MHRTPDACIAVARLRCMGRPPIEAIEILGEEAETMRCIMQLPIPARIFVARLATGISGPSCQAFHKRAAWCKFLPVNKGRVGMPHVPGGP